MSAPLIIPMPGNEALAASLAGHLRAEIGRLETRRFPDGETYLRFACDVARRDLVIVCTLAHPDEKILPLLFAADAARDLGAAKIGLVAPYLAYMRQDRRFHPGEAVTSRSFAQLISGAFDWLVTVDPHLHRYRSLAEIYSIPARAAQAAPLLARWIAAHIANPFLIGPDRESKQWIAAVAKETGAPYAVFEKNRRGDREVVISAEGIDDLAGRTPVLLDDIVSSGQTMIEAVRLIGERSTVPPVCLVVHGIFAGGSDRLLAAAGARVVTSNSVPHDTNAIDVAEVLAPGVGALAGPCD